MPDPAPQGPPRVSPDYGGAWGHAFFHGLIRLLGVRAAYLFLAAVVPYYVLVRGGARRAASWYLRRRFPGRGPLRRWGATLAHFYRFGQVLIDQGCMGILGPEAFRVDFPEREALRARAGRGKGVILLTSHVGNWRTAMAHMGELGTPVHFQFKREAHMEGRHFFDLAGSGSQFRFIDPDGFLGGMVEMTNALRAGECVAVMGDRAWGARTRTTEFLGAPAAFPAAAYQLARVTGADLVVLLTARLGRLHYRIEAECISDGLEPGLCRAEAQAELLRRYVGCLERYLERHAFLWFNFFDFWSKDKSAFE